jgi:hypothetical protein
MHHRGLGFTTEPFLLRITPRTGRHGSPRRARRATENHFSGITLPPEADSFTKEGESA